MAILDEVVYAIGEVVAHAISAATGRTFHLEQQKARRIGEYFEMAICGAIVAAMIIVTFVYS